MEDFFKILIVIFFLVLQGLTSYNKRKEMKKKRSRPINIPEENIPTIEEIDDDEEDAQNVNNPDPKMAEKEDFSDKEEKEIIDTPEDYDYDKEAEEFVKKQKEAFEKRFENFDEEAEKIEEGTTIFAAKPQVVKQAAPAYKRIEIKAPKEPIAVKNDEINDILDDFDAEKAFVYAEIFNRKY